MAGEPGRLAHVRVALVVGGARCGVRQAGRQPSVDDLELRPIRRRDIVLVAERFVARCSSAACQRQHQGIHRGGKVQGRLRRRAKVCLLEGGWFLCS